MRPEARQNGASRASRWTLRSPTGSGHRVAAETASGGPEAAARAHQDRGEEIQEVSAERPELERPFKERLNEHAEVGIRQPAARAPTG